MNENLISLLRAACAFSVLLTLLLGVVYPALSTGLITALFPKAAEGSLLPNRQGSALIGQSFTAPGYFWGRLSATAPEAYNAASSTGSNYSTNNPALLQAAKARVAALKNGDPGNAAPVPVDLVTASGSGLDPHITPAAAEYQVPRVAHARGMEEREVRALVAQATEDRQLGVLGEPRVNVLLLNLSLDAKHP